MCYLGSGNLSLNLSDRWAGAKRFFHGSPDMLFPNLLEIVNNAGRLRFRQLSRSRKNYESF